MGRCKKIEFPHLTLAHQARSAWVFCQCSLPSNGFIYWLQVKASPCRTSLGSFLQFPPALDWLSALRFPGLKVVKTTGLGESQQNSSAAVLTALEPRRGLRVFDWQKNLLVPWLCQLQAETGGQDQGTLNLLDGSGWLVHRWLCFKGCCFLHCLFLFPARKSVGLCRAGPLFLR